VSIGFLPPEDGTGRGIGHVSYTLQAKAGLPTGTQIRNVADIVFDEGQIISTDQIDDSNPAAGVDLSKQCLLTIDAVAPTSTVASLPPTVSSNCFTVSWSGTDDPGGSGLAFWDIYASRDGAPFQLWLYETTNSSALFQGEPGVHYGFFSVATDEVGNVEATPSGAQAQTVTTFRLTRAALAGTAPKMLVVNWESATNKLYDVWQSTNLSKGFTLQVATNVPATPPINLFSNSLSASGPLFLRVVGKP
jgi:hypothetical protein